MTKCMPEKKMAKTQDESDKILFSASGRHSHAVLTIKRGRKSPEVVFFSYQNIGMYVK
jgi:hypothetical protein